ncbi:Histidine phosphatase superfamily (branch 2) [Popillia japonica]|uniref:Histidine phosphatase superfamily (Branch 2) n=1 Tax=Popillia japonica TaxID=7064 RepID=A0AAW1HU97_POPJA
MNLGPSLVLSIFRHGEKTPDNFLMLSTDPYKNQTFHPYGPSALTNEGKRTMYTLGRSIRKTYNAFLGDIYTPDILTAWASSIERCHTSLQLVLAALFPPKGVLIWEKGFNWQPISYNSLPKNLDDMFSGILFEDYKKLYNEYCFTGNGKVTYKEAQPVLAYAEKHTNTTFKTFLQMFFLQTVLSGEEVYGLE